MTNATSDAVCADHTSRQWLAQHSIINTTKHSIFRKNLDDGNHEDYRLLYCWIRGAEGCGSCIMSEDAACGWCPQSGICIPTNHWVLSPLYSEPDQYHCPGTNERFDLRTRGFGCAVSSATLFVAVISVLGTLALVGLITGIVHILRVWASARTLRRARAWRAPETEPLLWTTAL